MLVHVLAIASRETAHNKILLTPFSQAGGAVPAAKSTAPPCSMPLGPAAEAARQEAWAVYGERWADKVSENVCVCLLAEAV